MMKCTNMDILRHKNLTVENWEGFNKIPKWFREAETVDAVVSVSPSYNPDYKKHPTEKDIDDGLIIWAKGRWISGTWKNGLWSGGTWEDGIWENGTWYNGTWYKGTWEKGTWAGGTWLNGRWITGYWQQGTWANGKWHDGVWADGLWINGYRGTRKCFGFDGNDKPIW